MDVRAALSQSGITDLPSNGSPIRMDATSAPPISGPAPASIPPVNGSLMNRHSASVASIAPGAVKVEPSTISSISSAPAFQDVPPVPCATSQGVPSLQTSSPFSVSQEILGNFQGSVSMGHSLPGMNQGNLPGTQMALSGMDINQNMMSGVGQSSISGTGTTMPAPGIPHQVQGKQSVGVNNNTSANAGLPQQTASSMQSTQSKYVKVWEGNLFGKRRGEPTFITKLEGYRGASAYESLAADWPSTMEIVELISHNRTKSMQYVGKIDFLIFRAMNHHGFLGQLQEKKLCAFIQLPSQKLLLSVSDRPCRLIGMLFQGEMVVLRVTREIFGQQQLQTQQHPQLQQQQQQQQQMQQEQQQ